MKKFSAKAKYGTLSAAFTLAVIAGAVFINLIMGALSDRFPLKFDMTKNNLYELSDESTALVKKLEIPVTITVLADQGDYAQGAASVMINELLSRYKVESNDKITLKFVDLYKNPAFADQYPELTLDINSLIIESDKRKTAISEDALYESSMDINTGESYISGLVAEQKITSAIDLVTKDTLPKARIVIGHNETTTNGFLSLLNQSNYNVDTVNLATEELPDELSLIILGNPKADFSEAEIDKLDNYLQGGGDMIVLYGTDTPSLSNLDAYFEKWGVKFPRVAVFDENRAISHPLQIAPYIASGEMTEPLSEKADMLLVTPAARQIELLFGSSKEGVNTSAILVTGTSGYGKAYAEGEEITTYEKAKGDKSGQFVVGALSQKEQAAGGETKNTRILFLGSTLMIDDNIISTANLLNSYFLSYSFGYLDERGDTILITPKNLVSEHLNITGSAPKILSAVLVVLLPLLIVGLGFYQWRKRRNL